MESSLRRRLEALGGLDPAHRFAQASTCKLCGHAAPPFDVTDFWKFCAPAGGYNFGLSGIAVTYQRCVRCGFIFTHFFDDWTHADFARFVYNDDYIKVDGAYAGVRPAKDAEHVAGLLAGLDRDIALLDYGAGSGLFGAALKTRGYANVVSYDPFSSPVAPEGLFDVITLFEVIEHVTDPALVLRDVVRFARPGAVILFSSGFQPANIGTVKASWWYIAPRNGHCSIFSLESMALLAETTGLGLRGEAGLCALALHPASAISAHVTKALPPPRFVRFLNAPGAGSPGPVPGWFAVEKSPAGLFRWSAQQCLEWELAPPPCLPCRIRVILPFMMQSRPDYIAGSTLTLNGCPLQMSVADGRLCADIDLEVSSPLVVRFNGAPFSQPVPGKRSVGLAVFLA